jgi:hypothetical protein
MNLQNIISDIEKVDPEIYERTSERRDIFKNFGSLSKKIALTALPFALGSVFSKAYGQTTSDIIGVLNFALKLEYLEYYFYQQGVANPVITTAAGAAGTGALTTIRDHENAHVNFLRTVITQLGGTPITMTASQFDYTAKGNFPTWNTNYDTYLAIAQTFEDTGVRAYKGQAGNVKSNRTVLTAALNIHSVEARHASHIRQMRFARGATTTKPWITGKDTGGIGAAVQASYNGEDNVSQAGVTITNINGLSIGVDAATEAFDEPLTATEVTTIVTPFFV